MRATDYAGIVAQFDQLPNAAIIPDLAAAMVIGVSVWTLRRNNPVPQYQMSPRCRGRRVGDIRALRATHGAVSISPNVGEEAHA